ncbi:MAG: hypothetical protein IID41_09250 [Planctomycetes bacterium]|nr:hypothetical protein [Planctomycetota bacterium]
MATATDTAPKLQPPRDPFLRAIWKVRQVDDLTSTQQLALLVLWRLLHNGPRQIGAGLLAALMGISTGNARNNLSVLQQRGYIKSSGKFREGRQSRATRELTSKLALPKDRSTTEFTSRSSDQKPSPFTSRSSDINTSRSSDIDLGVRHTVGIVSVDTPTANNGDGQIAKRTVCIADLIAADGGGDG